jgi:hypothetical protein
VPRHLRTVVVLAMPPLSTCNRRINSHPLPIAVERSRNVFISKYQKNTLMLVQRLEEGGAVATTLVIIIKGLHSMTLVRLYTLSRKC